MHSLDQAKPLTPRQAEYFAFIKAHIAEHGQSPTMQVIADHFGASKTTAFEHVGGLEHKGWITREKHAAHSIRLVERFPTCGRGGHS